MRVMIRAIEYCLPRKVETIEDLAREHPEWPLERIVTKTGVAARHLAAADETAADLAVMAAEKLFASGVVAPEDIDFVLFCTQTPDYILPTTACTLQARLGIPRNVGALDYNLGCSGFIYGLGLAKGLISTGQSRRLLLLTADTYNKLIHPDDRSVRTIFGDGAAATLVVADDTAADEAHAGIGPFVYGTDGEGAPNLCVPAGGMRQPITGNPPVEYADAHGNRRSERNLFMHGRAIYSFALKAVPGAVFRLLEEAGLELDDIDCFVFHQASAKVLEALQHRIGIPRQRFFVSMRDIGNTVSSTIPIALKDASDQEMLRAGDRVMLVGFGVGYSWGATIIRWR